MSGLAPSKEKLLRLAHVARRYYLEDWKQIDIARELGVPVKFIGVGEKAEDLMPFEPEAFVEALLS